jgi:hypothetical protein
MSSPRSTARCSVYCRRGQIENLIKLHKAQGPINTKRVASMWHHTDPACRIPVRDCD